ncbi:MAG: hypothetical protein ISR52_01555 [Rhodospirillales bacterium]|nr:hypothetical protein [Rhodospirillales bacterium]
MIKLSRLVLLIVVAALIGGSVFLATWDIPAPVADVKKVLPDDRFPR